MPDFSRWCRDEACERIDLHETHVVDHKAPVGVEDAEEQPAVLFDEAKRVFAYLPRWSAARPFNRWQAARTTGGKPWLQQAPKALDHSIAKAVSKTYPKGIDMIVRDVENDFGACNLRTVQRRLQKLVDRGHVLRIDLGQRLYAFVRPGSTLVNDVDMMREQIREQQSTAHF